MRSSLFHSTHVGGELAPPRPPEELGILGVAAGKARLDVRRPEGRQARRDAQFVRHRYAQALAGEMRR